MFKIVDEFNFNWPVEIRVPSDGGKFKKHEIEVRFKGLDQTRISELVLSRDEDLLREVVVGWTGIQDEDGNELAFSPDILDSLLDKPFVRASLTEAYLSAVNGVERKN